MAGRRIAIVGAGWAGLAAAVQAARAGHQVVLSDMAGVPGGRARSVGSRDNGQHLLIGAYRETLALMRTVGVDPHVVLLRQPLAIVAPDGSGLALPSASPAVAWARGLIGARGWRWRDRIALARWAWAQRRAGFSCPPQARVADLCAGLPERVRAQLLEPLCLAALNTPAEDAAGDVFLRVIGDACFGERGGSDLLLPRRPLSDILPEPARRWLAQRGVECRWRRRAMGLAPMRGGGWRLDGEPFDAVVLACGAPESARLVAAIAPRWQAMAQALRHEAILTVVLRDRHLHLGRALTALNAPAGGASIPAQFVVDLGACRDGSQDYAGCHAWVCSAASRWLADGVAAAAQEVLRQARATFPNAYREADALVHAGAERRATFVCTPALQRPPMRIAPGLLAAGDHVDGPYPATLEGAVRSGLAAAQALH